MDKCWILKDSQLIFLHNCQFGFRIVNQNLWMNLDRIMLQSNFMACLRTKKKFFFLNFNSLKTSCDLQNYCFFQLRWWMCGSYRVEKSWLRHLVQNVSTNQRCSRFFHSTAGLLTIWCRVGHSEFTLGQDGNFRFLSFFS